MGGACRGPLVDGSGDRALVDRSRAAGGAARDTVVAHLGSRTAGRREGYGPRKLRHLARCGRSNPCGRCGRCNRPIRDVGSAPRQPGASRVGCGRHIGRRGRCRYQLGGDAHRRALPVGASRRRQPTAGSDRIDRIHRIGRIDRIDHLRHGRGGELRSRRSLPGTGQHRASDTLGDVPGSRRRRRQRDGDVVRSSVADALHRMPWRRRDLPERWLRPLDIGRRRIGSRDVHMRGDDRAHARRDNRHYDRSLGGHDGHRLLHTFGHPPTEHVGAARPWTWR